MIWTDVEYWKLKLCTAAALSHWDKAVSCRLDGCQSSVDCCTKLWTFFVIDLGVVDPRLFSLQTLEDSTFASGHSYRVMDYFVKSLCNALARFCTGLSPWFPHFNLHPQCPSERRTARCMCPLCCFACCQAGNGPWQADSWLPDCPQWSAVICGMVSCLFTMLCYFLTQINALSHFRIKYVYYLTSCVFPLSSRCSCLPARKTLRSATVCNSIQCCEIAKSRAHTKDDISCIFSKS